ncbi:hypothetical protein AB1M95_00670 [Sulfitobacter sp. LCG007]
MNGDLENSAVPMRPEQLEIDLPLEDLADLHARGVKVFARALPDSEGRICV